MLQNTEFYKLVQKILTDKTNLIGTYNGSNPAMAFDSVYKVSNAKGLEVIVRPGRTIQNNYSGCHTREKIFFVLLTQNDGAVTLYEAVDRLENYPGFNKVETRYVEADIKQGDKSQAIVAIYDYC